VGDRAAFLAGTEFGKHGKQHPRSQRILLQRLCRREIPVLVAADQPLFLVTDLFAQLEVAFPKEVSVDFQQGVGQLTLGRQ